MIDKFRGLLLIIGAVTLPLFFLPLTPEDPFLVPKQVLLSILSSIALVALLYPVKSPFHDIPKKIQMSSLFFLLSIAVSILVNGTYHTGIDEMKRWIYLIIIFFTSLKIPWDTVRLQKFIKVNIIVCTIVSLSCILEFYELVPFYTYHFKTGRLYSFFGHQNIMAQYIMVIFILGIGYTVSHISVRARVIYSISLIIIGIALLLSFSRGAILSTALGVILLIFFVITKHTYNKNLKKPILILTGLFTIIGVSFIIMVKSGDKIFNQILFMLSRGDTRRFDIWSKTIGTIYESPFFGVGLGNYSTGRNGYVHNELLQTLVETGIIGLVGFFVFLFIVFNHYRKQRMLSTAKEGVLHFAFFSACLATAAHSMVSYNLHSATSSFFFFLGLGILCSVNKHEQKRIFTTNISIRNLLIVCIFMFFSLWSLHGEYKKIMGHYYFSKTIAFKKMEDMNSGIDSILKAIKFQPYNSRYYQTAGKLYLGIHQYELAQNYFKKAVKFQRINYD